MNIAIPVELDANEPRVAATPDTVKRLIALGNAVTVESGAGKRAGFPDADFSAAGAKIANGAKDALANADIVLKVRRPAKAELSAYKPGAMLIGILDPYGNDAAIAELAAAKLTAFTMEFMPRITRAQTMDVLSSPGESCRLQGGDRRRRRIRPGIADDDDRRRHGACREGVRHGRRRCRACRRSRPRAASAPSSPPPTCAPRPRSRSRSLGAKFVAVEDEEFKQAETAGGYAKEMSKDYQAKQAELVAAHIAKQDIVITTALIPGRPAPKLVSKAMVESMKPGSVIVDLAVERGGNVELTKPGEVVRRQRRQDRRAGSTCPAALAATASALYAKNLFAFLETMFDKKTKAFADQLGRRDRQGDAADQGRRRRASEPQAQRSGLMIDLVQFANDSAAAARRACAAGAAAARSIRSSSGSRSSCWRSSSAITWSGR